MKSFSKLKLNFDKNDKGYCQVEITNKSGISKSEWIKFNDFLSWLFLNTRDQQNSLGTIEYSKNLITTQQTEHYDYYYFLYQPSIRDVYAYKKGKYIHKTIFLPALISRVSIYNKSSRINWNIKIYAFNGKINKNTKYYALKLPHFYDDGGLCLGNLSLLKKVKNIKDFDNLLNYIFATKFSHEWTEENEEFTKPLHYNNGFNGLKNYNLIKTKLFYE